MAWRSLLAALASEATGRAAALADSLIDGHLVIAGGAGVQAVASHHPGFLPIGVAYAVRLDLLMRDGDYQGARRLARKLIGARLPDPKPYLYAGMRLAGLETLALRADRVGNDEIDLPLAMEVLAAGLPWATEARARAWSPHSPAADLPSHVQQMMQTRLVDRVLYCRLEILASLARTHGRVCATSTTSTPWGSPSPCWSAPGSGGSETRGARGDEPGTRSPTALGFRGPVPCPGPHR